MITKREKLQYVYVFLTDLAALAASVILAWPVSYTHLTLPTKA